MARYALHRFVERKCAICGRGGSTTPLTLALRFLGIPGNYAHTKCVEQERKKAKNRNNS